MPPDTLITVAQKTEEKGAKEAKETEQDSKVNAGTVALLVIKRMNVGNLVEEQAKAKAKARERHLDGYVSDGSWRNSEH